MYNMLSGKRTFTTKGNQPKVFLAEKAGTSAAYQPSRQQRIKSSRCPRCRANHRLNWCNQ